MLRFLSHTQIDKEKWDDCIESSLQSITYAYSWYLDAASPQWDALIIEENNTYAAVFPLTVKKKFGLKYLAQPTFAQQLGLFSKDSSYEITPFIDYIKSHYQLAEISLNAHNKIITSLALYTQRTNLILDLNRTYDEIKEGYNNNRKRNLKKAYQEGIRIEQSNDIDLFVNFFIEQKGLDIKDLSDHHFNELKNIHSKLLKKAAIEILFAYTPKNEIVAGGLFVVDKRRTTFLLGTANKEGKKTGAMTFIMDNLIKRNCDQNHIFDFDGSNSEGVAKFYKSLGGIEKNYISLKMNHLSFAYKLALRLRKFVR